MYRTINALGLRCLQERWTYLVVDFCFPIRVHPSVRRDELCFIQFSRYLYPTNIASFVEFYYVFEPPSIMTLCLGFACWIQINPDVKGLITNIASFVEFYYMCVEPPSTITLSLGFASWIQINPDVKGIIVLFSSMLNFDSEFRACRPVTKIYETYYHWRTKSHSCHVAFT